MPSELTALSAETSAYDAYLNKLEIIYAAMDRSYNKAADAYGFRCTGCKDSCCLTLFHHHTVLEFLYLAKGLKNLSEKSLAIIRQKAQQSRRRIFEAPALPIRVMCPLNQEGRCVLYPYRPMICRLHGIPHELQKPGQKIAHGSGCHTFSEHYQNEPYQSFDRTPHYRQVAQLEKALRQETGLYQRLKMTVADMVLAVKI
jgi:Fe-S-cluster containining protein